MHLALTFYEVSLADSSIWLRLLFSLLEILINVRLWDLIIKLKCLYLVMYDRNDNW